MDIIVECGMSNLDKKVIIIIMLKIVYIIGYNNGRKMHYIILLWEVRHEKDA